MNGGLLETPWQPQMAPQNVILYPSFLLPCAIFQIRQAARTKDVRVVVSLLGCIKVLFVVTLLVAERTKKPLHPHSAVCKYTLGTTPDFRTFVLVFRTIAVVL